MLQDLRSDLRYALRGFRSSPGFAAIAIVSLALGIGANTAIFSLIDAVLLKTLPVSHPEQLVQLSMGERRTIFSNPLWEQVRDRQDVFSGIMAYGFNKFNLATGGEAQYANGILASGEYFSTLGVHAILGRTFTAADDRRGCAGGAVLTYDFWQSHYGGSPDILGRNISLEGHPFPIIGVTEPGFTGVDVGNKIDAYLPICAQSQINSQSSLDQRSWWWIRVIGRPKPEIGERQALARMKTLAPGIYAATVPPNWPNETQTNYKRRTFEFLPAATGISGLRNQYRVALWTLMALVGAVFLIACANVANLLLARAASRRHEMAIRLAIGAPRIRLIRQLLTESILLSLCGAALGILLARWGSQLLVGFLGSHGTQVFLDLRPDGRVLAFTIGVALATGILFGLAPAFRGSRVPAQAAMKESGRGTISGASRFALGKVLVMGQVGLSLVLLTGAGLMVGTFRTLATMNPGFAREGVLLMDVNLRSAGIAPEARAAEFTGILERVHAIPGVAAASTSNLTPISGSTWDEELSIDGFTPKSPDDAVAYFNQVSSGFFETMAIPMVAGRDFSLRDSKTAPKVGIVNEAFAKHFFGNASPLGRSYRAHEGRELGPQVEIVGLVKDSKYTDLRDDIPPTVFVPASQVDAGPRLTLELRAAHGISASSLIPSVKAAMAEHDSRASLQFELLSVQLAESLNRERLLATLSGFFGGLALLLAAIGLYGVMSYSVAQRRNEIGIRMALGAEQARVMRMVLGEVALLIGMGLIAGIAAALASTKLIATFLYGVQPRDATTLILCATLLAGVAVLAGYLPARRASQLDPMVALREE